MIIVAIGANLPAPAATTVLETCESAARSLEGVIGLRCIALSRWYESDPVPPSGQPPYVNGVACLDGDADPAALLLALQRIEAAHGRVRSVPNAARTLDLDIVAMGGLVRDRPDPILPHPRMHLRGFVLVPMVDVAPGWRHPVSGLTVEAMLAQLPPQGVRAIGLGV